MTHVTKSYLPDIKKYKSYIDRIFETNWVTNHGAVARELDTRLKEYLGVRNLLLVANGTLALQIAYKALGLKGDVITTPFSFVATTSSLVWENLNPLFVDIDINTFCIDHTKIEKAITPDTTAMVPVHVFGNACEIESIQDMADKYNLKVIYDAAHTFGEKYKGRSLVNYGDISVISFHATKIFHTCEGGALIIKDDAIYEKAKKMIDFGITGEDVIEDLGINAKMNEFEAAMGHCILDDMDRIIESRRRIHQYYSGHLPETLILQKWNASTERNYTYFPVVFASEKELLEVKAVFNAEGIYPRRYFYPSLDSLTYLKQAKRMPVSRDISSRILCLPIFADLEAPVQRKIVDILHAYMKSR